MEQFLQVGAITSTHGIRGEVKVFPTTDDPARFKKLKKVILDTGKRQIDMEIQSVRFFKQFVIVKFKGIDNINDVEQYKGSALFVSRDNAVRLEENEYYIADLIGMEVFTDEGHFGVIKDVMETGANEVYIIDSDSIICHAFIPIPERAFGFIIKSYSLSIVIISYLSFILQNPAASFILFFSFISFIFCQRAASQSAPSR